MPESDSTDVSWPAYTRAVLDTIRAGEQNGRLPTPPPEVLGSIFPFEPDVQVVAFDDPELPEPARSGIGGVDCRSCSRPDADYIWVSDGWRLSSLNLNEPLGVHALMLTPRRHCDHADLTEGEAAEQGQLLVRIERAIIAGIDGVGRVHFNRWGDGGEHLHWWLIVRPVGLLQLRGSQLPNWLDVLPPLPDEIVRADLDRIVAGLDGV